MAEDITSHLAYWLRLDLQQKAYLGQIRHWDNLKVAQDEKSIWVKDFTQLQFESTVLKVIPFVNLFYTMDNLLFPKGSLLPAGKIPSFLWTPIARAVTVELTGFNHNFFGIHQQYTFKLLPTNKEQEATVLLIDIRFADSFIETAPAARLCPLQWALVNNDKAIIVGKPLLPVDGAAYWQKGVFILPVGYAPEFEILEKIAAQTMDSSGRHFIWWIDLSNYCLVPMEALQQLSIASWRQTAANKRF